MPTRVDPHAQSVCAWVQLSIGRWDESEAGGSDVNFQGPISQRHFLHVGYTYLEWRLTPLGLNPPHTAAAQLMKHVAHAVFLLFIFITPAALLPFPPPFSLSPFFCFHVSPTSASCIFYSLPSFSPEGRKKNLKHSHISPYHHVKSFYVFALQQCN